MLSHFISFVSSQKLFTPKDHILLAVSGGVDSVVMAQLFYEAGFSFSIAHCNFSLRGKESDDDSVFVKSLADKFGVKFFSEKSDAKEFATREKCSIQEAARKLRYKWFEEIRKKNKFSFIATAHHADDSIETFFINLLRGTGLAGLTGIPLKNGKVIRPISFSNKDEILAFAHSKNIIYREDSSNESDNYLRNSIRHSLLPLLKNLSPSFQDTLIADMKRFKNTRDALDEMVLEQREKIVIREGANYIIPLKEIKEKKNLSFFLFEYLKSFGFNESVISNLSEILKKKNYSGKMFSAQNFELHVERNRLLILRKTKSNKSKQIYISDENSFYNTPFNFQTKTISLRKTFRIPVGSSYACLDKSKLSFPLLLRKWRQGDRFSPLGMKGTKLLSDYFTDEKVSAVNKKNAWVMVSNEQIIWIVGYRLDERFKLHPGSKEVFRISLGMEQNKYL